MTTKTVRTYDARIAAIHKLRVNLKSLVAESRIIRFEERRAGFEYWYELYDHRVKHLREELRYTGLAIAFVRGRPYRKVEATTHTSADPVRLAKKIHGKYKPTDLAGLQIQVTQWLNEPVNR